jgi:XTP/dITP diphosphohydrolase
MKLLVATHNQGKVAELNEMLTDAGIVCLTLDAAGVTFDVEETGATFIENATLKATTYAAATRMLTLADDSGLEIDALDGAPGVYSARYGGRGLQQPERNALVLRQLAGAPPAQRSARFRCAMVLADAAGHILAVTEGRCEGEIANAPSGSGGFGYDPLFYVPQQGVTLASLSQTEKQAISHRGHALRAMLPHIYAYLGSSQQEIPPN